MKSTLALVAMAAAATANASAPDAVLANAMAFFNANNGRRVLADGDEYKKGKCGVKGQSTNITGWAGMGMIIPTTGFCMATGGTSMLLTCDGVKLNAQTDDKPGCKQITEDTTKIDMSSGLGPCIQGEVEGIELGDYAKSDCSDVGKKYFFENDFCMDGMVKTKCGSDKVTYTTYPAGSKCTGDGTTVTVTKSEFSKCHMATKEEKKDDNEDANACKAKDKTGGKEALAADCDCGEMGSCAKGKYCWMGEVCLDIPYPCASKEMYCGRYNVKLSKEMDKAYKEDFKGGCLDMTTCPKDVVTAPKDGTTECAHSIKSFNTPGKCQAVCSVGWTKETQEKYQTEWKCTDDEKKQFDEAQEKNVAAYDASSGTGSALGPTLAVATTAAIAVFAALY